MSMQITHQHAVVNTLDEKILLTLFALQEKHRKAYSFPSQLKILSLVRHFYGLTPSRRTLNYHLRALEDTGFLTRKRRIKRLADGTLRLATSLYFLTARAFSYLKGICAFVVSILKARPEWVKQFQLKDQIAAIKKITDPDRRRGEYIKAAVGVLT